MAQYVYTMNRVGKLIPPKRQILKDISLSFFPGAKIGVLGLNGAGKSTLLRIMAGVDREIEGEAVPMPGLNIGFLPQEPQPRSEPDGTARGRGGDERRGRRAEAPGRGHAAYAEEGADFDALAAEQAKLESIIAASGADSGVQMEIAADALRLPPWDAKIATLSGGEKRRVALCRLLLSKPDMLLLDEPTNHLDAESVDWLEQFLQKFPGTVVAVTHDRYFLDNAAEWILELDRGYGIPWKGNYSSWLEQKEQRLEVEAQAGGRAHQGDETGARVGPAEPEGPAGEEQGAHRPLQRARVLRAPAAQRDLRDLHSRRRAARQRGDRVQGVSKGYGDRLLIDDLSFKVPPGAIVGVIGPNGAGKTTLFKLITGKEKPDAGEVVVGHTAQLAVVDQTRESLPNDKTAWEAISNGQDILTVGRFEMPSRAYLGPLQLQGAGPAEERGPALRRRARPAASRGDAAPGRQRAACWTSRPTTSTSRRCARSRKRCSSSRAACS